MNQSPGHHVSRVVRLLLAALLVGGFVGLAQAAIVNKIAVDARLTQPTNNVALNAGTWDGGSEDGGNINFDELDFDKAGFDGFKYSECFFYKNLHTQHIVRLPNKNGEAYFAVTGSDYIDNDIGIGIDRRPNGRISVYKSSNLDPVTDLVTDNPVSDGQIVWEHEFTISSPVGEWNHPGKMTRIGGLLLLSNQNWVNKPTQVVCGDGGTGDDRDAIVFYDVRDPANPQYWGKLDSYELGQMAVQMLDTDGDFALDSAESGLSADNLNDRDTYKSHWSFNPYIGIPQFYFGMDGKLDANEVIPSVGNASLFRSGDEWVLSVSNFWFRTRYVSPDIKSWLGGVAGGYAPGEYGRGGIAVYPFFTNTHGDHFTSQELYFSPQTQPPEYGPSDLNQPGELRPMFFDGSSDGTEHFTFAQVQFSPPDTSTPTATTTQLERINSITRNAPNIFPSDNDYDGGGIYVTRNGAPVIYSARQTYPKGKCLIDSADCTRTTDCAWYAIGNFCIAGNKDTIYQITHPDNVGGTRTLANLNDSGAGSLRTALSTSANKIIIGDNLDAGTLLLQSPLVITHDVEIDASGLENGITIERAGGDFFRIFEIQPGATVTMDNLTITKGYAATTGLYAGTGIGGGVLNNGNLTLNNCKVYSNQSDSSGGGIAGMPASTLVLNNTEVSSNSSAANGAGIWSLGYLVSLNYSSVKNNNIFSPTGQSGGGIYFSGGGNKLVIDKSTISGNNATQFGGGIYASSPQVDITDSAVLGNVGGDVPTHGGGLYFRKNGAGPGLRISGSMFYGNRASVTGGGIYYINSDAGLIENTTIANNTAETAPGAGISGAGSATAFTLRHVTIAGNTAEPAAGAAPGAGVYINPTVAVTLENTLIADNVSAAGDSNLYGETVTTIGANLVVGGIVGSVPSGPAPLTSDPNLGPLADYGGFTKTLRPLPGSAAIDAAVGVPVDVDQRNVSRPIGSASDLGAVEVGEAEISVEQSPGVIQVDGVTTASFDPVAPGGSSRMKFSIRNAGTGHVDLTGLAVTLDGPDAAAFSVSQPTVTTLQNSQVTGIEVIFTPGSAATHTAMIHITSSDADESPFDITLQGPGWTPIVGIAGLVYHLDAALQVDQTSGVVAEWRDSSRNGASFSQTAATRQPAYIDGASAGNINGNPVIRFDGDLAGASNGIAPNADQLRYLSNAPGVCSVASQACSVDSDCPGGEVCEFGGPVQTLIVVARTLSFNYLDGLWGSAPDTGLRRQDNWNWNNGTNANDFSYNGGTEINRDAVSAGSNNNLSPLNTPEIIVVTRSSATKFSDTRLGDYFEIAPYAPRPWHGDIAEIAVFDHLLTDDELQEIQFHLETKYGIAPAPVVVTTGADEDDGGLGLGTGDSLRELLKYGEIGLTINLDGSTGDRLDLTGTPLAINRSHSIDASGLPNGFTIDGNGLSTILTIGNSIGEASVTLRGLTLTNGSSPFHGGAIIHAQGELILEDSTISHSIAATNGGGIFSLDGPITLNRVTLSDNAASGYGGAIFRNGLGGHPLTIINTTISGNTASVGGAIANEGEGDTTLVHASISNNSASSVGGGIDNNGTTLNIEDSIVANNCMTGCPSTTGLDISNRDAGPSDIGTINPSGANLIGSNDSVESFFTPDFLLIGDVTNRVDPGLAPLGDFGGPTQTLPPLPGSPAIGNAVASILAIDQRGYPRSDGSPDIGAVEMQSYSVSTILDENDASLGLGSGDSLREVIAAAYPGSTITFQGALSGQTISLSGTQLLIGKHLVIDASGLPGGLTLSGNGNSRVFEIAAGTTVVLQNLAITNGVSAIYGGGIRNSGLLTLIDSTFSGNTAVYGGGLRNESGGTAILDRCTLFNNHVTQQGGAIYSHGDITLTNTTISGNTAPSAGGGIAAWNETTTLVNVTVANNGGASNGGGVFVGSGMLNIENSIVAGNTSVFSGADIKSQNSLVTPAGANLIGDNNSVSVEFPQGPLHGTTASPLDAMLAPIGDYGGATSTRLLLYGSPAIDMAISTGNSPATDQRGVPRPQGIGSDLGAVEVVDSDGDGLDDEYENLFTGTSAFNVDSDGDGLVDGAGGVVTLLAYPGGIDIDGDGFVDGESDLGTDPAVSNLGDVAPRNSPDNLIDLGDLLVLTRLVTGTALPSDLERILGDINGDSLLNVPDILLLQQSIMNGTAP